MAEVTAGNKAPDFDLETDDGGRFRLSAMRGKKVVVYFYPKDDTQGCTIEAIDFTKTGPAFEAAGTTVVGISPDTTESHCKFRDKHAPGRQGGRRPGAQGDRGLWSVDREIHVRPQIHGRRAGDLSDRSGRPHRPRWDQVKVPGHVEEALAAAEAL